jgi:hypothetical protein
MPTINFRNVLLCLAILLQVLSLLKHNGVAYLGIPPSPEPSFGATLKPGEAEASELAGTSRSTNSATTAEWSNLSGSGGGTQAEAAFVCSTCGAGGASGSGGGPTNGAGLPPARGHWGHSRSGGAGQGPTGVDTPGPVGAHDPGPPNPGNPGPPDPGNPGPPDTGNPGPPDQGGAGNPGDPGTPPGPEFEFVDLISNNDFEGAESQSSCFRSLSEGEGDVHSTTARAITGSRSLGVHIPGFGSVGCDQEFSPHQGPVARTVTAATELRIDSLGSGGPGLNVCVVVFYEGGGDKPPQSTCQEFHEAPKGQDVVHVQLTSDAHVGQLHRVAFLLETTGAAATATLDNAHLLIEQVKGSGGPQAGGGGAASGDVHSAPR